MRQPESLVLAGQIGQFVERLRPRHAALHVDRVQFRGRRAGGVFAQERNGAHALDHLASSAQIQYAQVEATRTLGRRYYGGQRVRKISESNRILSFVFND